MSGAPIDPIIPVSAPEPLPGAGPQPEPIVAPAPGNDVPAAPAPIEPAPVEPAAPAAPARELSILEKFDLEKKGKTAPSEITKPVEKSEAAPALAEPPKAPEATPPEAAKPDEPAPVDPAIYAELKLPDGFTADAEKMGTYSQLLAENRLPAEVGQKLLDLHAQTMQDFATKHVEQESARQHKVWNDMRADWRKQVLSDERIGGAGHQTAMGVVARMRDLGVPEADMPAFESMLVVTGVGDHPAFLRMLHNFGRLFDEPSMPPPNPMPPPNNGRPPGGRRMSALYTNTK